MSYSVGFETASAEELDKHIEAFKMALKDEAQKRQIDQAMALVPDFAAALGIEEGKHKYRVQLHGHAGAKPGQGDSIAIHVTRGEDLPEAKPEAAK